MTAKCSVAESGTMRISWQRSWLFDFSMRCALMCLAMGVVAQAATAGSISGIVRAQGKEGADQDATGGKYDSRKFKFVDRVNYADMRDFVVFIEDVPAEKPTPPSEPVKVLTKKVTQKGAMFAPHVLPVLVGTTVEWPNNDDIFHNVFSISDAKQFDLGLYKHPEVKRVTFEKPGRVDVF